jgi:hypothetical protein
MERNRIEKIIAEAAPKFFCESGASFDQFVSAFQEGIAQAAAWPQPDESAALTLRLPKTAAMAYDRVWTSKAKSDLPREIGFGFATEQETRIHATLELTRLFRSVLNNHDWARPWVYDWLKSIRQDGVYVRFRQEEVAQIHIEYSLRKIAHAYETQHRRTVVPLYDSIGARELEFAPGPVRTAVIALGPLPVPNEALLSWPMVESFRQDRESVTAYRTLLHADPSGLTELKQHLENYRDALNKHNIPTVTGMVTTTIRRDLADAERLEEELGQGVRRLLTASTLDASETRTRLAVVHESRRN